MIIDICKKRFLEIMKKEGLDPWAWIVVKEQAEDGEDEETTEQEGFYFNLIKNDGFRF